jgi:hypothetical protein
VNATEIEVSPVMATKTMNRGSTSQASVVEVTSTAPAISQTARSMYQRFVGTM